MFDGLYKAKINTFWDRLAPVLVRMHLTPNMVTLGGLGLVILSCLYFVYSKNSLVFGIFLALSFITDYLDGAVARITGKTTRFGSYLDAVVDRYQEIFVYFSIAFALGYWISVFWVVTGSLLVSYNKARAALETPISNHTWPDLLERTERLVLVIAGLLLDGLLPDRGLLGYMLILIGLLVHFTAIQRFFRARSIIVDPKE